MRSNAITAIILAAFVLIPSAAMSRVLAFATRASDFSTTSPQPTNLPLNDNDDTAISFKTLRNNVRVFITFNSKCGATGAVGSWISVAITVDGNATDPNNGEQFAMCGIYSVTEPFVTSAVRTATTLVPTAGTHTVVVTAAGDQTGASKMFFGESILTVSDSDSLIEY